MALDPTRIVDDVAARVQRHRESLRAYLDSMPTPPGLEEPSDEEFLEFVKMMISKYPAQPLVFPIEDADGQPVLDPQGEALLEVRVLSPWLAMLALKRKDEHGRPTREPLVDGGEEVLARIEKLAAQGMPSATVAAGEAAA